ncbi:MAG: glycosyltransferase [Vicinamibacteria bacterium]|nr:glycosyltransferase [Vicinamibacteria bacterium]
MRILLTTHAFLPDSVAGVEVYTFRLATALVELGHAVAVVTAVHDLAAAPHTVRRRKVGLLDVVEVVNTHAEGTLQATYRNSAIDGILEELIRDFRPDCLHAQHLLNLSSGLFVSASSRGLPIFLTLHDYWLSCPRDGLRIQASGTLCVSVDHRTCASCLADSPYLPPPLQRGAVKALQRAGLGRLLHLSRRWWPGATLRILSAVRHRSPARPLPLASDLDLRDDHLRARVATATAILAPTRFAAERAIEWGAPGDKVRVLSLGAITGPTRKRQAASRRRFAYLGTVAPHKGLHVMLEALMGLPKRDWRLDIIGNPAINPAYTERLWAIAQGDERIRFRGPVPPAQNESLWSSIDVLVLPSLWWENSPLAVLEALAAGIPVVASRTGGVPEILPSGAGILVPPGDVAGLRGVLEDVIDGRLFDGPLDPLPLKTAREGALELSALYDEAAR